jgi:hypothetical protein
MKMSSLKEEASAYEQKRTLNIVDLDKVDLSYPVEDRTGTDKEGKAFNYKVIVINSQEYRVPNTVLEEIKKILKLKPETKFVKVTKKGTGLNTSYAVEYVE